MHTFCFTELCKKEVICSRDGRKLGYPTDIEIDAKCGQLLCLIVPCRSALSLFSGKSAVKIPWQDVERVGCDVIWVSNIKEEKYERHNKSNNRCC